MLITLSGTHGTGKSTAAGICYHYLNRMGLKHSYIRMVDILIPFGFVIKRGSQIFRLQPTELEGMKPFRFLWAIYILLVYVPFLKAGILVRRTTGSVVFCDRYLYDLIVTFRGKGIKTPFESLLPSLLPTPDISFLLSAPTDRILRHRPEHARGFIEKEQRMYLQLANRFQLCRIDAAEPATLVAGKMIGQIIPHITEQTRSKLFLAEERPK